MFRRLRGAAYGLFCIVLIVQFTGCGTLLYPERRGQKGGRIDIGVALLDGIGLLFFLIPGIIAYAVDFTEGTIYLPGGAFSRSPDFKNIKQVKFDPKQATLASIEKIIQEETGCTVSFEQPEMRITRLRSTDEIMMHFAYAMPETRDERLSLAR